MDYNWRVNSTGTLEMTSSCLDNQKKNSDTFLAFIDKKSLDNLLIFQCYNYVSIFVIKYFICLYFLLLLFFLSNERFAKKGLVQRIVDYGYNKLRRPPATKSIIFTLKKYVAFGHGELQPAIATKKFYMRSIGQLIMNTTHLTLYDHQCIYLMEITRQSVKRT